jgi:hypothetical protein
MWKKTFENGQRMDPGPAKRFCASRDGVGVGVGVGDGDGDSD